MALSLSSPAADDDWLLEMIETCSEGISSESFCGDFSFRSCGGDEGGGTAGFFLQLLSSTTIKCFGGIKSDFTGGGGETAWMPFLSASKGERYFWRGSFTQAVEVLILDLVPFEWTVDLFSGFGADLSCVLLVLTPVRWAINLFPTFRAVDVVSVLRSPDTFSVLRSPDTLSVLLVLILVWTLDLSSVFRARAWIVGFSIFLGFGVTLVSLVSSLFWGLVLVLLAVAIRATDDF